MLLLLHGALGSAAQLSPLATELSPTFTQIHTFDFEGHGGKNFTGQPFTIAGFAQATVQYITEHATQPVNIFGYSMGGYVGLYIARHFPQWVNKVCTLATKFAWEPQTAAKEAAMLNPQKIKEKVPAFAAQLQQRHQPNDWELLLHQTANMMLQLGNKPQLTDDDFTRISCPVKIGVGDQDNMVTLEETITTYRKLPNAQLMVLPATKHPFERISYPRLAYELANFF